MKKNIVIVYSVLISFCSFGQNNSSCIHPELGCTLSNNFYAELGIMRSGSSAFFTKGEEGVLLGYKLACESNLSSKDFVVAPKISTELDFLFLALRLNLENYIYSGISDLRFNPEIGGTLFGFVTLCVGDNIPILNNRLSMVDDFRISLNINFNRAFHQGEVKFF